MDADDLNAALREKILEKLKESGDLRLNIGGLGIYRRDESNIAENCFYKPLCTVAIQGTKWSTVGGEKFYLKKNEYLVAMLEMPAQNYVVGASKKEPFLSIAIDLDLYLISQILTEHPELAETGDTECKGAGLAKADSELLSVFLRLLTLAEDERKSAILAPTLIRELHLILLLGPLGRHLCAANSPNTSASQIARATAFLRKNYRQAISISQLAKIANMSLSTFHRQFKQITKLSPIQYQKRLRMYEAKRLMIAESKSASSAAYEVGYESYPQFNREYKRLFGDSPKRNLRRNS